MKVIVTIPPYADYLEELAAHPMVSGFRLNTVMPLKESIPDCLRRLKHIAGNKPLWLDLKCRQIRISRGLYFKPPEKPFSLEIKNPKTGIPEVVVLPSFQTSLNLLD